MSSIGMFDITLTAQTVLADPAFSPYDFEIYTFIGTIYAVFCLIMSRYSRYLEARFGNRSIAARTA